MGRAKCGLVQNCTSTSYLTVPDRPIREGGRSHHIPSSKLPSCHRQAVGHAQLVLEEWKLHLAAALVATSGTQWSKWDTLGPSGTQMMIVHSLVPLLALAALGQAQVLDMNCL